MADRKPFLLRIDRDVLDDLQRWADDELRSVNGQIEFVLRRALETAGRTRRGRSVESGGSGRSGKAGAAERAGKAGGAGEAAED